MNRYFLERMFFKSPSNTVVGLQAFQEILNGYLMSAWLLAAK